ncbi:hypothetical protein A2962_03440 [Candidatus Woesebacteria bacterium RIFCSPLOWO2_01_FULL_39_61]|uniref:Glycosyltransferase RgtA/B/C/D-like domain-containing protein n=1 Tax=Candidatus Woesebacteria bacterium RIFCSPHIGHO2_02_FULL_39_13 TaxID=1802505 RepID=A0A1F7Z2W0_9BACT|nr:MAG: hypothetical protein A2692_04525 [Candidatus Woesebacteria bacterium RIFCSPHIGHO2_01_FULL_39_95]OGM33877.1 MAG: hypothetical protein A3D01_02810 [Candidatus Woesebacteria bacterium RIFCSPHIGHO2_02_FULL_39_13]OGM39038.1 MAG: hypothetical protein A3E13_05080 [Candidatus Woesebacteria bacterium RIFCSPHIGHO2_12_FULL_40_20]OGM67543.1 MAG: hypothetical protein A2962_03440 [Candidatus Woesebacteria bacterium RIFCSPLOWO2_01_FULL_39_61]OGM73688.1 MAG: hypothetical protein A3H19_06475 [Candidatus
MAYLFLIFSNLTSYWLWKIVLTDWLLGLFIILTTLLLFIEVNDLPPALKGGFSLRRMTYKSSNHPRVEARGFLEIFYKKEYKFPISLSKFFIIFILVCVFLQTKGSTKVSLTDISNDDRRLIDMRLKEYPPIYIKIGQKKVWLPIAHWFEERKESIAFFRLSKNFSEVIDPNLYFFANHPRERVGIKEIEKFSFMLLPVFIYGALKISEKKDKWLWIISFAVPLAATSVIGNYNSLGPVSLYPFFVVTLTRGLTEAFFKLKSKKLSQQNLLVSALLIIYFLTLIH